MLYLDDNKIIHWSSLMDSSNPLFPSDQLVEVLLDMYIESS